MEVLSPTITTSRHGLRFASVVFTYCCLFGGATLAAESSADDELRIETSPFESHPANSEPKVERPAWMDERRTVTRQVVPPAPAPRGGGAPPQVTFIAPVSEDAKKEPPRSEVAAKGLPAWLLPAAVIGATLLIGVAIGRLLARRGRKSFS